MEDVGYKGGAKVEDNVDSETHREVKPEDGGIVALGGFLALQQCGSETTVDKQDCKCLKNQQRAYQTEILRR